VACDALALEVFPFDPMGTHLHGHLIALLGMPIGELWALDALAADCAADGRYTGLLTAAPLNIRGGVGSPADALALRWATAACRPEPRPGYQPSSASGLQ
jgi:hypothetical protein